MTPSRALIRTQRFYLKLFQPLLQEDNFLSRFPPSVFPLCLSSVQAKPLKPLLTRLCLVCSGPGLALRISLKPLGLLSSAPGSTLLGTPRSHSATPSSLLLVQQRNSRHLPHLQTVNNKGNFTVGPNILIYL